MKSDQQDLLRLSYGEARSETAFGGERFDMVIEWLLISLLAFMPLAFGAVEAWSEEVVIAFAAAISISFLLKMVFTRESSLIWYWAYILVGLFICVAIFQLISLPSWLVGFISPATATIKRELLGDLPNSAELLKSMTLSFYPNATKHDLRLILAVAAVFFVIVNTYRRAEQVKRLLAAIAVIGAAIAILALAQDLFGNGKIYWLVPTGVGDAYSGTFINHSHYGQFMNLSMGAALGFIMVKLHEAFTGKKVTPVLIFEYLASSDAIVIWFLVLMIVVSASSVFVSLSRGGTVSMLIAGGFTTMVLSSRQSLKGRGWIMVLMALGAFICVLYTGFDAVYDRLATLRELHEYEGRWQIVKDITVAWTKFPILGTGIGTHEVAYPMFDRSTVSSLASHAENEYAQTAEESGLVGLIILIAFAIIVWLSYVRNVTMDSVPIRSAAYGLGFGLAAIMIHSLSDFGQHLPANAFLSAVSCALMLAVAGAIQKDKPPLKAANLPKASWMLRVIALVCASGVWAWVLVGANSARVAESNWKKALVLEQSLMEKDWLASDEEYINLISNAVAAVDCQPDNVTYRHWLNVYRWRSITRVSDPNTDTIIIPDQAMEFVRRIVADLNSARCLCPTYGASYCVLGQLEKSVLGQPNGAEHIRKGYQLAPCDSTACFVAGLLDVEQGYIEASFAKLSRAVELDSRLFNDVAAVFINHLNRPDLAVELAGENTGWLSHVANVLAERQEHEALAEQARARIVELLKSRCEQPDAPAWELVSLAGIYRKENNNEAAIECYRRALALDYGQVGWRFALARLLADMGHMLEAIHEARICLRLQPQFKPAEKLIADLSVHLRPLNDKGPTQ